MAECLAPGLRVQAAQPHTWEHPARCAELWWQGRQIGRLSELHPGLVATGGAAVLDIDLGLLQELAPVHGKYTPVRRFPTSFFDLTIICAERELAGTVQTELRRFAEQVEYVREYTADARKSLTFRFTLGDPDRTLTEAEITAARTRIIEGMQGLGYELKV